MIGLAPLWLGVAAALAGFTPMDTAETVPPRATMLQLGGGLALLRIGLPVLPVLPVPAGTAELAHGVLPGLDMRLRYHTELGLIHHLSAEVRGRLAGGRGWALALRVAPAGKISGAVQQGVDYAGAISTDAALLATLRRPRFALTLDAGATVQWSVFQSLAGQRRIDSAPYPAYVNLALSAEVPRGPRRNLVIRLETSVSLVPDDPFAVLGMYPRILAAGNFGL